MPGRAPADASDEPLLALLQELDRCDYDFVTPTPATHERVLRRKAAMRGRDLRDVLGWSLPFDEGDIPRRFIELLRAAEAIERQDGMLKSAIRVSRLHGGLFIHSAFPTTAVNSVFLGPDSYRFANWVAAELGAGPAGRLVDVGAGAGVGAIVAARASRASQVLLTDINPLALRFARVNAAHAGVEVTLLATSGLDGVDPGIGTILANPPYMAASEQTYRSGGDMHGARISLDWARAALGKLRPGGRLLLYTGSAILDGGVDALRLALQQLADQHGASLTYAEADPDVFGEELETKAYGDVERIAVVTAILRAAS